MNWGVREKALNHVQDEWIMLRTSQGAWKK